MVSIKIYTQGKDIILAACDKELLGKEFSEGELKLHVKKDFYGGETTDIETFSGKLEKATIANLVGERVVNKAIELGLVTKENIIKIDGVPHAQIVNI